jgi:hypothetical protein
MQAWRQGKTGHLPDWQVTVLRLLFFKGGKTMFGKTSVLSMAVLLFAAGSAALAADTGAQLLE